MSRRIHLLSPYMAGRQGKEPEMGKARVNRGIAMLRRIPMGALVATVAVPIALIAAPLPASATILEGFHQVMNRQSKECLDVTGAATWNGAEVKIWRCVNHGNQRWRLIEGFGPLKQLQVEHTGKCLSVQGRDEGSNVVQDVCENRTEQRWFVKAKSDGYSQLVAGFAHPSHPWDMCLDKAGGDVTVWPCHDGWWQQWQSLG